MSKKKLSNISGLRDALQEDKLSYKELMEIYNLTRWGARKLREQPEINVERGPRGKALLSTNRSAESLASIKVPVQADEPHHETVKRKDSDSKQSITRNATKYLRDLERQVKNSDAPDIDYTEPEYSDYGVTAIIHETDSHFSAHVKDMHGDTVYNSDIARRSLHQAIDFYIEELKMEQREIEDIVLLFGGDFIEGEGIYEGQAHKVDEQLDKQIETARGAYFYMIRSLRDVMPDTPIKVVCVSGNHGDLKIPGSNSGANADDILYSQVEDMVAVSDIDNVKFVRSDRSDYTVFNFRGWKGYLTHGENRSNHIGTSSPQSDWLALKDRFGFDAAWRGHYHCQKKEDVNGAPVYMTNSRKPADDYTDQIAAFGNTGNAIYFSTDEQPVEKVVTETDVVVRQPE